MHSTDAHLNQKKFDQPTVNHEKTLHEFVLEKCKEHGNAVAVVNNACHGKSITFREIHEQSRKCAAFLHEQGIGKGDFVGLCTPNSPEYAVAMFGIMACGATVAPCDPNFKEGEIMQQFTVTQPKVAFVHETALGTMKKVKENLPCLQEIFVVGNGGSFSTIVNGQYNTDAIDGVKITLDDLAMIPHSSGTTGLPKGIMLTHKNLVAQAMTYSKWFECNEVNCIIMDRPIYRTYGALTLIYCLLYGKKLVTDEEFEIDRFIQSIHEHKVTHVVTVPTILIRLGNEGDNVEYNGQISSLKQVLGSGAPLSPKVWNILSGRYKVKFVNLYSTTEGGDFSCNLVAEENPESVGFPVEGIEMKITDPVTSAECPAEQSGEILVRGPQIMKGYLKNPEANSKTFDDEGWFRTGDIGYLDNEGHLYLIGRLKEVIKYKGQQISPAELESVILEHPKIADVGVIGIPDEVAGELPKAFVVRIDVNLAEEEVDELVKSQLAEYKQLRGGVKFVGTIPRSESGKILRKELHKMAEIEI